MHFTFTKEPLYIDDIVVYLKNERTGSSTIRKCKFIGQVVDLTETRVKIGRLSPPDKFATPEECQDYGIDTVCPDDVVHVIISRHQLDNWLCLPHTIGNVTFYDKKELVEWIENQQTLNEERNKKQMESVYRFLEEYDGVPVVNPTF